VTPILEKPYISVSINPENIRFWHFTNGGHTRKSIIAAPIFLWIKTSIERKKAGNGCACAHDHVWSLPVRAASGHVSSSSSTTLLQNKCGFFRTHILLQSLDRRFCLGEKTSEKGHYSLIIHPYFLVVDY
jgi:hypothetical protein